VPKCGGGGGGVADDKRDENEDRHDLHFAAACRRDVCRSLAIASAAQAQQAFKTPEAAAEALVDASPATTTQVKIVSADLPPHPGGDRLPTTDEFRSVVARTPNRASGNERDGRGRQQRLDGADPVAEAAPDEVRCQAAPAEMRAATAATNWPLIQVMLAYTDAQEEFYASNPDGRAVKHFAMRALSSPGKRDGLYWASLPDEPESPLGAQFADARQGQPYHGYVFRILTAQGKDAPGGAKSYVRNGLMTEGYALIAHPERYGDTGVMSFIVSRDGVVHQKNLGPNGAAIARAISAYNPDSSWEKVTAGK
jgi:hypothetical protein